MNNYNSNKDWINQRRDPDKFIVLLTNGNNTNQGFIIQHVELRQYVERNDPRLGNYSLLTVVVKTDQGRVEMKYDEGFRGDDAIESAAAMLREYTGFASLINRAVIELKSF